MTMASKLKEIFTDSELQDLSTKDWFGDEVNQDWENETTYIVFKDNSQLVYNNNDIEAI